MIVESVICPEIYLMYIFHIICINSIFLYNLIYSAFDQNEFNVTSALHWMHLRLKIYEYLTYACFENLT